MTDEPRANKQRRGRAAGGPGAPSGRAADRNELAFEIKVAVVRQALEDPEYRRLALRDPKAAVSRNRFVGDAWQRLPARLRFRVVEETSERLYLVIPHQQPGANALHADNPKDVLLQKAMSDPAYLNRLVADPRSVIEAEFLVDVPSGFEVVVLKETPQERIAVLPADLRPEQVAGVRDDLLVSQSSGWPGGGGGCNRSVLGSIIENLCPGGPPDTQFQSPNCTTSEPQCQIGPSGVSAT
jgi:hypothetical protein